MRIVITGNIGSGKTTACKALAALMPGFQVAHVDVIAQELYIKNPAFMAELQNQFGTANRKSLAEMVRRDPSLRGRLDALTMRYLTHEIDVLFERSQVIIEFPSFYERGRWIQQADFVIALGCEVQELQARVLSREGMTEARFKKALGAQYSTPVKALLADAYINTHGSPDRVERALSDLYPRIQRARLKARCIRFFGTTEIWPLIACAYGDASRSYHTLEHLDTLFEALDPYAAEPLAGAREMAVWFHDYVYERAPALYGQNEAESAKALYQLTHAHCSQAWLGTHLSEMLVAMEIILATKAHQPTDYLAGNTARLRACHLVLDADIAILGARPTQFERYDRGICQEWGEALNPRQAFIEARRRVLEVLEQRSPLYFTREFEGLTAQARENINELLGTKYL